MWQAKHSSFLYLSSNILQKVQPKFPLGVFSGSLFNYLFQTPNWDLLPKFTPQISKPSSFSTLRRTYKVDWGEGQWLTQIHPVSFHDLKTWVFPVPLQCFNYYSHWFLMFPVHASSHTDTICAGTSGEERNCLGMYNVVFL